MKTYHAEKEQLTTEQRRRVVESIIETQRHLDRELSYMEKHQNKDMIDFYHSHIAKLRGMLAQ